MAIKVKEFLNGISGGNDKKLKAVVAIGLIGIILIFSSELFNSSDNSNSSKEDESFDYAEYTQTLESKLENIISSIDGAGSCKIMITLENTTESVYAKDNEVKSDESSLNQKDEYVLYDTENGETPVFIMEYMPKVQGVTVLCDGGDNIQTKEKIINTVTALFNISSSRVSVSKIKE